MTVSIWPSAARADDESHSCCCLCGKERPLERQCARHACRLVLPGRRTPPASPHLSPQLTHMTTSVWSPTARMTSETCFRTTARQGGSYLCGGNEAPHLPADEEPGQGGVGYCQTHLGICPNPRLEMVWNSPQVFQPGLWLHVLHPSRARGAF